MAFSPYVHRYSNHARLLKGYGSKTNTDILSSDVFSVFKKRFLIIIICLYIIYGKKFANKNLASVQKYECICLQRL